MASLSFRDWAGDQTAVPREVAEAALAHSLVTRLRTRRRNQVPAAGNRYVLLIASLRIAESMGFKGEFRQWEELLRLGD